MSSSIDALQEELSRLPGIGPRQARRVVYALIERPDHLNTRLADLLRSVTKEVQICPASFAYFIPGKLGEKLHPIERDESRERSLVLVVERTTDLERIEASGVYHGRYFVLGGTLPFSGKEARDTIRIDALKRKIEREGSEGLLKELVIATSFTPEGEHTREVIMEEVAEGAKKHGITISTLGRGLSTGTELEYVDKDTMKNALQNRHTEA